MSRLAVGIGGGLGAVAAAGAIEGSLEKASRTNEDSLLGMLGMLFGGIAGAAIGGGCPDCKTSGTVSGQPPLRFP